MEFKVVNRNIPPERENKNDRFRVKYNDRNKFELLQVKITRIADGNVQVFNFKSDSLPDKDSIHFSTTIKDNTLIVNWYGAMPI